MEDDDANDGPIGYVFAVADNPFCCWDFDHPGRTLEFLQGIDPSHFGMLGTLFAGGLETDDEIAISIALRTSYQQGVETLMSLLGAAVQAPAAIPAWIAHCQTNDLIEVVGRLRDDRPMLTQVGRKNVSFLDLAEHVHRFAWTNESGDTSTAARYGRFWRQLSTEFLDATARAEYNALKHGNRVVGGGFTLAIGIEEVPGVPARAEAMQPMGGSRFGSTFFVSERAGTKKHHIRMRRTSINWSPEALALRLGLVSMSITNVIGALRCGLGADATTVEFVRPDPLDAFDQVWQTEPSSKSFAMDSIIQIDERDEISKADLLDILENRGGA